MKCDLHVHTLHSGMCGIPVLDGLCRESYNHPEDVYRRLKRLGMDLVTVTDHDSMEAAETLRRYPDFFPSEEVTCRMPSGTRIHLGVYGLTERDHLKIQRRREDLPALLAYLRERRLFFSINHPFSALTGAREAEDFDWLEHFFPAVETRNGLMPAAVNREARRWARRERKIELGGSDSHTLASLGAAYTEVAAAHTTVEFLDGLRAGAARVRGRSGGYFRLTRDVLLIVRAMTNERAETSLLAPLALLVPAVTGIQYLRELAFARCWARRLPVRTARNLWAALPPLGKEVSS